MTTKKSAKKEVSKETDTKISPDNDQSADKSSVIENPGEETKLENPPDEKTTGEITPDTGASSEPVTEPVEVLAQLPIVLVVTKSELLAEAISKNLIELFMHGMHAIIPNFDPGMSLVEKITDLIANYENEVVVVFDSLVPVNVFGMHDLHIFAERAGDDWNYNTKTPVVLEREKIVELLEEKPDIPDGAFLNAYFRKFYPDILPTVVDWRNDTFTLPIVSEKPSKATLKEYLSRKRWYYVSDASTNAVLEFFK